MPQHRTNQPLSLQIRKIRASCPKHRLTTADIITQYIRASAELSRSVHTEELPDLATSLTIDRLTRGLDDLSPTYW